MGETSCSSLRHEYCQNQTPEGLEEMLGYMLSEYEQVYGRDELAVQPSQRLQSLVKRAYKKTGQRWSF